MNRADFDAIVAAAVERTATLLVQKGAEYAGDSDCLANFKRNAEKQGVTVLDCWATYWGKHVDSINSFMARVKDEAIKLALVETAATLREAQKQDSGELRDEAMSPVAFRKRINDFLPQAIKNVEQRLSEPIEGRFDDNINYSFLCMAILDELRTKT